MEKARLIIERKCGNKTQIEMGKETNEKPTRNATRPYIVS